MRFILSSPPWGLNPGLLSWDKRYQWAWKGQSRWGTYGRPIYFTPWTRFDFVYWLYSEGRVWLMTTDFTFTLYNSSPKEKYPSFYLSYLYWDFSLRKSLPEMGNLKEWICTHIFLKIGSPVFQTYLVTQQEKKKKKPKMYLNISNRSLTVHLSNKIVEKRFRDMINSLLVKYQSMNWIQFNLLMYFYMCHRGSLTLTVFIIFRTSWKNNDSHRKK